MINKKISEIIKSRKSIYPHQFNGEIISKEVIIQLIKNANYAPSHKMTQPWRFKIFLDNAKNKLLQEILKLNKDISENKKHKLEEKFEKSSHIICICMKKHSDLLPEWEEIAATSMAVQNLWLSCSGSNIGGYWSTPKFVQNLNKFLSLDENEKCLGLFYLGVYEPNNIKLEREDINKRIQWYK